jgi:selenocysteine lyase/cysteine desulfurase
MFSASLLTDVRSRFAHVDSCPFQGPRVFFENAGGALTLKTVVETAGFYAGIPDNPGRVNAAGQALQSLINEAKIEIAEFFNAPEGGQVIVGESGTELVFRVVSAACLGTPAGTVLSSSLEHPCTRSAAGRWSQVAGKPHVVIAHDDATGRVTAEAYAAAVTPETQVVTILHTSPVTGMSVDIASVCAAVRAVAPHAMVIVDGIQHACHGDIDLTAADVDAYVISPYKVFSRHGYGIAWMSARFAALPHDTLEFGPPLNWELGTRDAGAYATMRDVIAYFDWLGGEVSDASTRRGRIEAAGVAIHAQEHALTEAMLHGVDNVAGLVDMPGVTVIGGVDNPAREGLVSFAHADIGAEEIVARLNAAGFRTHVRKADHYSGNILTPLGLESCTRVSLCHYNTKDEVRGFLTAMTEMVSA